MEDLQQIRFPQEVINIAEKFKDEYGLTQNLPILKFAFAYAINNFKDQINFETEDPLYKKNDGSNYNVNSFDSDSSYRVSEFIKAIYPNCETPYRYLRTAIIFGIMKLKGKKDWDPDFRIIDVMPEE